MEQARFWMWAKKKPDRDHIPFGDSWEEQAFAEDAAGALGGCVWPPKSYSCSFCRREFRSAQALGGHMNVHRRDRARLKESPPTQLLLVPQDPAPLNTTCTSHTCTFLYNHNPNPEIRVSSPSPSPPAAVKVINSSHENTTTLSFSPTKNDVLLWDQLPSWSSFVAEKRDRVLGSNKNKNSVNCGKKTKTTTSTDDADEIASWKRKRTEEKTSSLFPIKFRAVDGRVGQSEVSKLCPVLVEELDLELRLGRAPKVK